MPLRENVRGKNTNQKYILKSKYTLCDITIYTTRDQVQTSYYAVCFFLQDIPDK